MVSGRTGDHDFLNVVLERSSLEIKLRPRFSALLQTCAWALEVLCCEASMHSLATRGIRPLMARSPSARISTRAKWVVVKGALGPAGDSYRLACRLVLEVVPVAVVQGCGRGDAVGSSQLLLKMNPRTNRIWKLQTHHVEA